MCTIFQDQSGNLWTDTWDGGIDLSDRNNNHFIDPKNGP